MHYTSDQVAAPSSRLRSAPELLPWLAQYPKCVPTTLEYPPIPAFGLLEQTAKAHPTRVACHYYNQRVTYAQLLEDSRRIAAMLVRLRVAPGDRVGVLLPNLPECIAALNGIWMAGASVVAVSPLMCPEEVAGLLKSTGCRVVIALDLLLPLLPQGESQPEHILVTTLGDRLPRWQQLLYTVARWKRVGFRPPFCRDRLYDLRDEMSRAKPMLCPIAPQSLDEPAFILATGGTTSAPKAVVLSHRNLIANAWQLHHWAGAQTAKHKILAVVPFFHSFGLTTCVMAGTAMAATLILHHRFVPRLVLKLIARHQPSVFHAVPAMLVALNELLRQNPIRFEELRFCVTGGAPLDPKVADEFAGYSGATVVEGYGLSEASPVTHTGPLNGTARGGTIGLPLPDTRVRIVDRETGRGRLGPGEIGELVVQGPQVMTGYWNNQDATDEVIRDGWLYTGDLATCDEDGFFRIVDRKKDLIITSGFNVYPNDVEQVLRQAPGIADVAVVGQPDAARGEIVKAIVTVERGRKFDRKAFDKFARMHLARHKVPRAVQVISGDLPRNFLGKVLRRKLRNMEVRFADAGGAE